MHIAKWKMLVWKDYILYALTIGYSEKGKTVERVKPSVFVGSLEGGREMSNRAQAIFRTVNYSVWYYNDEYINYTFVKTHTTAHTKSEPQCNVYHTNEGPW